MGLQAVDMLRMYKEWSCVSSQVIFMTYQEFIYQETNKHTNNYNYNNNNNNYNNNNNNNNNSNNSNNNSNNYNYNYKNGKIIRPLY